MSSYSPLLSVDVEHAFWQQPGTPLRCQPSVATLDWIKRRDLLLRPQRHGVALFCDAARRALLLAELASGEAVLAFKWYAQDALFSQYSQPATLASGQLLVVTSGASVAESGGLRRLHGTEQIDATQAQPITAALLAAHLERSDGLRKPVLVALIDLADQVSAAVDSVDYVVRFGVRKSIWKYFFISDDTAAELAIVDLDERVRFVAGPVEQLPGNRRALVFTSASEIAMQQRYGQRFQLREQGGMGERVLIRRLPNADVSKMTQEMVGSKVELVSEIYIN